MYPHRPFIRLGILASLVLFNLSVAAQQEASPVQLLAGQPDFVADEILFSAEEHGDRGHVSAHELLFRKAKKGKFYRTDTGVAVFFEDSTKPGSGLWFEGAQYAESFAREEGIRFEFTGKQKVQGYECVKIKATKKVKGMSRDDEEVYFHVAQDLRNLVIATQVITPGRRTSYVLRNISFDVPADLFKDAPASAK